MIYRRLSSGEAAVIDKDQSKPKLIKRYKYDEEYYPDVMWIPPFFIALGALSLALSVFLKRTAGLGIVCAAVILVFGFIIAMTLIQTIYE